MKRGRRRRRSVRGGGGQMSSGRDIIITIGKWSEV